MHGINHALRVSFIGLIISDIVLGKYTDLWAVHIEGGEEVASNIAAKHGFVYHGQVREVSSATVKTLRVFPVLRFTDLIFRKDANKKTKSLKLKSSGDICDFTGTGCRL